MEIIKTNYADNLAEIMKDIEECAFVSLDGEFTGLASERNLMPFDTSEEYYLKQLKTSRGFILIQLGLTFFKVKKNPEGGDPGEAVTCKSYNIYVYPQSKSATFSCQGQSLSFLAENNFDFNKLLKSGISYCSSAEEEKLRQEVKEKQTQRAEQLKQRISDEPMDTSSRNFIPVPDNELETIEKARVKIAGVVEGKLAETSIADVNPYQRKLIYELIEREFYNKVSTSVKTVENNKKVLFVEPKRSEEEELKIEGNRQKDDEIYIAEVVGLRLLLKEISASKKLVVAHNCLLDLMFLLQQCFEPLPADYNEFKTITHRIFPNIIDTKFIGSSEKFKELIPKTVLNKMYERLTKEPFVNIAHEWENPYQTYSFQFPKEHEAGYDSYLTGYCFLVLMKYLKVDLSGNFEPNKCKELNPFLNRIALPRIQSPSPFIYLVGKEPTFSRNHVFFVNFPATWQTSDVQDAFKNYGPVNVAWVSSGTAFIMLYNRENASCVLKTINRPAGFEIKSFAEYQIAEKARIGESARKRRQEDSESSEGSPSTNDNGSKNTPKGKPKKKAAKMFVDGDTW